MWTLTDQILLTRVTSRTGASRDTLSSTVSVLLPHTVTPRLHRDPDGLSTRLDLYSVVIKSWSSRGSFLKTRSKTSPSSTPPEIRQLSPTAKQKRGWHERPVWTGRTQHRFSSLDLSSDVVLFLARGRDRVSGEVRCCDRPSQPLRLTRHGSWETWT